MPTYQYACTECQHAFEQVQSFSDDSLTVCPRCEGRLRKVYNAVGVVFKGSGFYKTDSRKGSDSSGGSKETGSSGGGDDAGTSGSTSTTPEKGSTSGSGSGTGAAGPEKKTSSSGDAKTSKASGGSSSGATGSS